jgi:pectin methylesterase-like acyl-CoA thioesterase
MTPGKYNMVCPQGSTFSKQLTYTVDDTPVDLSTYTARMQVRAKHSSPSPLVSLNTENGGISLGGEEGTINVLINSSVTEKFTPKTYVYDIELISSSEVYRLLEGQFIVTPEVTR